MTSNGFCMDIANGGDAQELQRQLLAQPLRSQSFWQVRQCQMPCEMEYIQFVCAEQRNHSGVHQQTRPFRVRSPQSGIQVGLVAASLSELQTEVAEALEIHHPWFIRLLLVEPDGRGATEILDERFFATVPRPPSSLTSPVSSCHGPSDPPYPRLHQTRTTRGDKQDLHADRVFDRCLPIRYC